MFLLHTDHWEPIIMCFFFTQMNEPNMYDSVFSLWPSLKSRDVNTHLVKKKKQKKTQIYGLLKCYPIISLKYSLEQSKL